MPGLTRSRSFSAVALLLLSGLVPLSADAQIRFDLPSQSLAQALTSVGSLANLNIYFDPALVDGRTAPALKANLSVDDALARLLAGTQLHAVRVDENTVRVVADSVQKDAQSTPRPPATGSAYSSPSMHLAYVGDAENIKATADQRVAEADSATESNERSTALAQVVVTAQKREERLQDVPVPVTAISADTLLNSNQVRIQDYYTSVPGLNMAFSTFGNPELFIRGISTGADLNPSVGVTVDDVPYGSTTSLGGGSIVPDLDPSDLQRVEVLRGPQGTLYGANSLGGLFKFVTVDPSTKGFSGRLQADLSGVHNGDEVGYGVRGAVNVPLTDTLALRLSGFLRRDPGYIDNLQTGQRAVNEGDAGGGHLSMLWRPSDTLSLKLSALFQDSKRYGFPDVDGEPGFGDLQQSSLRGTGGFDRRYQLYSAVANAKLGSAELTSITGYSQNLLKNSVDYSIFPFYDQLAQDDFGVSALAFTANNRTNKLSQEVRLAMPFGSVVDWLVGGFYTHEKSSNLLNELAEDPATGAVAGSGAAYAIPSTYEEYAVFTDFTFHVTSAFDIQLGGRESWNRQTYSEVDTGPFIEIFNGASPFLFPEVDTRDNAFTYLLTPQYRFTPDLMAYARIASGYRPGGPNAEATVFGLPAHFNPDKTINYEFGMKGDVLDHRLSLDASLYYITWKNIQTLVVDPIIGYAFNSNAGRAKSQGIELSSTARPLRGLTLSAWVSWDEAVLTEPIPSAGAYGLAGDRLPYSPRFSGSFSAQQEFPITNSITGFIGGTVAYVGYRDGEFQYGPPDVSPRIPLPPYAKTDLRAGIHDGSWMVSVFADNVTDRRGQLLNSGELPSGVIRINYITPRVIGLSVTKSFGP